MMPQWQFCSKWMIEDNAGGRQGNISGRCHKVLDYCIFLILLSLLWLDLLRCVAIFATVHYSCLHRVLKGPTMHSSLRDNKAADERRVGSCILPESRWKSSQRSRVWTEAKAKGRKWDGCDGYKWRSVRVQRRVGCWIRQDHCWRMFRTVYVRVWAHCLLQYAGLDRAYLIAAVTMAAAAHVTREKESEREESDLVKVQIKESHCSTECTCWDRRWQYVIPTHSFTLSALLHLPLSVFCCFSIPHNLQPVSES